MTSIYKYGLPESPFFYLKQKGFSLRRRKRSSSFLSQTFINDIENGYPIENGYVTIFIIEKRLNMFIIHRTLIYQWYQGYPQFFENGPAAWARQSGPSPMIRFLKPRNTAFRTFGNHVLSSSI